MDGIKDVNFYFNSYYFAIITVNYRRGWVSSIYLLSVKNVPLFATVCEMFTKMIFCVNIVLKFTLSNKVAKNVTEKAKNVIEGNFFMLLQLMF